MFWFSRVVLSAIAAASSLVLLQAPAHAADLPPVIRVVVPFGPGNALDSIARAFAENLSQVIKRSVIVDNKPGAGGVIGTQEVVRSKPDGSVLLYTTGGHTTNAVLYKKLPYDSVRDLTPITQLDESEGFLLLVRAESPYRTAEQYLQAARTKPNLVSFGSFGVGNTTHLVGELLGRSAGAQLLHIPFKSSPITDLIGGHVDSAFLGAAIALPFLQDGKLRALATTSSKRMTVLPNVPTFAELGVKSVNVPAWSGLWGPAGMQPALVEALHRAVGEAVKRTEYRASISAFAVTPVVSEPKQFQNFVSSEIDRYRKELAPLKIQLD